MVLVTEGAQAESMNALPQQFDTPNSNNSEIDEFAKTGVRQGASCNSTHSDISSSALSSAAIAANQCDEVEEFEAYCRWDDDGGNQWIR